MIAAFQDTGDQDGDEGDWDQDEDEGSGDQDGDEGDCDKSSLNELKDS